MDAVDVFLHLLAFVLPALGMALLLPLAARVLMRKVPARRSYLAQIAIIFIAGVTTLAASLWLLGQDGRMLGYAALVLVAATAQWLLRR